MAEEATPNETEQATADTQTGAAREPQDAGPQDAGPRDAGPQEAAPQAPEQPSEASEPAPSIGDLLAEYDEAVPSAKPADMQGEARPDADKASEAAGAADPRIDGLIDVVQAQELERLQAQEDADARQVLNDAKQAIVEFSGKLPEDFAERWLMSEYQLNPRLNAAWNQRHDSKQAMAHAERTIERALNDLYKAAESVPNAEATADQEAVAAAMRGASAAQPKSSAPDYGRMTDGEFRKSVENEHGYTPGV